MTGADAGHPGGAGVLRETVAIVGATSLAANVLRHLRTSAAHPVEIVGVFEDRAPGRLAGGWRSTARSPT